MRKRYSAEDEHVSLPSRWVVEAELSTVQRQLNLVFWAYDNLPPRVKHLIGAAWISDSTSYLEALELLETRLRKLYARRYLPEHKLITREMFQETLLATLQLRIFIEDNYQEQPFPVDSDTR